VPLLDQAQLPRLEVLKIHDVVENLGLASMVRRHGKTLKFIGLVKKHTVNMSADVFPFTPNLKTLRISGRETERYTERLRGLPVSVETVQLSEVVVYFTNMAHYTTVLQEVQAAALEMSCYRPPPIFQLMHGALFAEGKKRLWGELFDRLRRKFLFLHLLLGGWVGSLGSWGSGC
jgi:hypothetical protein